MSNYKEYLVVINGTTPLVMHDNRTVDPLHPEAMELKKYTGKKNKTEADHLAMRRIEFRNAMYHKESCGPYIPTRCLQKVIIMGARKSKKGKEFESGLLVPDDAPVLDYGWDKKKPPTIKNLYDFEDGKFVWSTVCGNQKSSIIRTRPKFDTWSTKFIIMVDTNLIDRESLETALQHAGVSAGLLDGRSIGMGRFTARVKSLEELDCESGDQALAMA